MRLHRSDARRVTRAVGHAATTVAVVASPAAPAVAAGTVASTAATVSAMTASAVPAGAVCTPAGVVGVFYALNVTNPAGPNSYKGIEGAALLQQSPNYYCGSSLRIIAQRKVCGFWGCNYHTGAGNKADSGNVGATGSTTKLWAEQGCYSGTHRYRNRADAFFPHPSVWWVHTYSAGIEYTCL